MISPASLMCNQEGSTAIEYALIAGVLSCAVFAGSLALSDPATEMYNSMVKLTSKTNSVFAVQPAAGPRVIHQVGRGDGGDAGSWVVEQVE